MRFAHFASILITLPHVLSQSTQNTTLTPIGPTTSATLTIPNSSPIPFPTDSLYTKFRIKGKRYWGARIEYADFTKSGSFDQRLAALLKTQCKCHYMLL
jgi:hypothetical protein